jgi:hypothetical protein
VLRRSPRRDYGSSARSTYGSKRSGPPTSKNRAKAVAAAELQAGVSSVGAFASASHAPTKYEENGYKPDFDELPLEADYWAAQEKANAKNSQITIIK